MIYRYSCIRCHHEWPSKQERPRVCPKCKSPWWDTPRGVFKGNKGTPIKFPTDQEVSEELKKRIIHNQWGRWRYDPTTHCLHIRKLYRTATHSYEVDLDRCDTGSKLLDWIYQVKNKNWISPDDISSLVYAVEDILGSVQGTLCSGGINHEFNTSVYLYQTVDPILRPKQSKDKK